MESFDVVVIGAGVCGMTVAHAVTEAGGSVALLDKARRPGGRLSSFKLGSTLLDTAATSLASGDAGVIAEVHRRTGGVLNGDPAGDAHSWSFDAPAGDISRRWCGELEPREAFVTQVEGAKGGDIHILTEVTGASLRARTVVVTAPSPQSLRILEAGGILRRHEGTGVSYSRQLVLLCEVDRREPSAGSGFFAKARWHEQGEGTTVELFATPEWSADAWDDDVTFSHAAMLIAFAREYPGVRVRRSAPKRWRYAERLSTDSSATFQQLDDNPDVILAGDGFGGGPQSQGLSRAVRSGLDAGASVLTR